MQKTAPTFSYTEWLSHALAHAADKQAVERVLRTGLPTPQNEQWHYTNLRPLYALPQTPARNVSECVALDEVEDSLPVVGGPQLTLLNGVREDTLTVLQTLDKAVTILHGMPLPNAPHLDALDSVAQALAHTATHIRVNGAAKNSLHLNHTAQGEHAVASHVHVELENNSTFTLVEFITGPRKNATWQHQALTVSLGQGATFHHVVVQDVPEQSVLTRREHITVADAAQYHRTTLQVGAKLARIESHLTTAHNAQVALQGLALTRGTQLHDTTFRQRHIGAGTRTVVNQRNILDDAGHAVFQGKFYVAPEAQQTDAYMLCNTMLLADGPKISAKPELEIYADDVKCSHGATTGSLQPEQLFYLQARGLSTAQARVLLLEAFAQSALEHAPEIALPLLKKRINRWLAGDTISPVTETEMDTSWLN